MENHQGSIDLLLTDVIMPEMNGKELYKQASEKFPDLKVLYMSGYADDVIGEIGETEKTAGFLQKPFSVKSLAAKVREILDK